MPRRKSTAHKLQNKLQRQKEPPRLHHLGLRIKLAQHKQLLVDAQARDRQRLEHLVQLDNHLAIARRQQGRIRADVGPLALVDQPAAELELVLPLRLQVGERLVVVVDQRGDDFVKVDEPEVDGPRRGAVRRARDLLRLDQAGGRELAQDLARLLDRQEREAGELSGCCVLSERWPMDWSSGGRGRGREKRRRKMDRVRATDDGVGGRINTVTSRIKRESAKAKVRGEGSKEKPVSAPKRKGTRGTTVHAHASPPICPWPRGFSNTESPCRPTCP